MNHPGCAETPETPDDDHPTRSGGNPGRHAGDPVGTAEGEAGPIPDDYEPL